MAKCKVCDETDIEMFYKSNLGTCRECVKARARQHRKDNIEKVREYDRNRPNHKERIKINCERVKSLKTEDPKKYQEYQDIKSRWAKENKHKRNAQLKVSRALYKGVIKRLYKCERCEETKDLHGHHPDYSKPLEVIWLCPKCHGAEHKRLNEIKRKKDGKV